MENTFYTYALFSEMFNKIYIGFTSNIEQRIIDHNYRSKKGFTVKYRPWKLIHLEEFDSKKSAMKREKQLKSAKGREFIWSLIKNVD